MQKKVNRRSFLKNTSLAGIGLLSLTPLISSANQPPVPKSFENFTPGWPAWPIFGAREETALISVLKSGQWGRLAKKTATSDFEQSYQSITGSKHALAVSSGTNALFTMLGALNIGPGDEVIIPPYTFIATYNVIALNYALPVFVDSDLETFQIDATKIEKAITPNTKVLMPVHIGGSPFDVDTVLSISKKHNIPLIEDACQAHLAEWQGKCVGNFGLGGAFSFQASKNLNSGEGGAVITNDTSFYNKCYSFHHQGQSANAASLDTGSGIRGSNLRISEFQSAILNAQLTRLKAQADLRSKNADYLTGMLKNIKGITPAKLYPGTTKSAYHLYMFRYDPSYFEGMTREKFIQAMNAEGISCSSGYGMMNKTNYITNLAKDNHYLKVYGEKKMNDWLEQTINCPVNDKLTQQAVWFYQYMMLGTKSDMEKIAESIRKIQKNSGHLLK